MNLMTILIELDLHRLANNLFKAIKQISYIHNNQIKI
jgi:hypothetical protein